MRASRLAALLAVAILAAATLAAPPSAGQGCNSVGVSPVRIDLPDAQPGQEYLRSVSVQNPCPYGRDITIALEGPVGSWASTEPANGFHLDPGPGSARTVQVTVRIPGGLGPGPRDGILRFTGAATQDNSGNSQVAVAAALRLNVTVGGVAIVRLAWVNATASDTDTATPPSGLAAARNDGNVAGMVRMAATVTAVGTDEVLASGAGERELRPGETGFVAVAFAGTLPRGDYVMRFASTEPAGFHANATFRVLSPGEVAPKGTLLAIQHIPYGTAGQPLRIDGTFRNDGTVAIRSAQLRAEVRRDGALVEPLQSDALAVPVGATVNLTAYWTPPDAGTYSLTGHVVYDGYLTPESSSPLNVNDAGGLGDGIAGFPWWAWLLLAVLAAAAIAILFVLRRRKPKASARSPAPPSRASRDARDPQPWQKRK